MAAVNEAYVKNLKNPGLFNDKAALKTINEFIWANANNPEQIYKTIEPFSPDIAATVKKQALLILIEANNNDIKALRALKPSDVNKDTHRQIINRFVMQNEPRRIDEVLNTLQPDLAEAIRTQALAINKNYQDYEVIQIAAQVNEPLTNTQPWLKDSPQMRVTDAMLNLKQATKDRPPELAAAIVKQALIGNGGLEEFYRYHQRELQNGQLFAVPQEGETTTVNVTLITLFIDITDHITAAPEGDATVARLVAFGGWPRWPGGRYISQAIGNGAGLAYALEVARQIAAKGGDPSPVYEVIKEGIAQFKNKVDADARKLGEHNRELASLIKNNRAAMTRKQLNKAIENYISGQGEKWKKEDACLRMRISADGVKLLHYGIALNKVSAPARTDQVEQSLKAIATDSAACAAISMALQTDPSFTQSPLFESTVAFLSSPYLTAKSIDLARKFSGELATSVLRSIVFEKLRGLDPFNPRTITIVNARLEKLRTSAFAKLLGVSKDELDSAIDELKKINAKITIANPETLKAVRVAALNEFEHDITRNMKGFAKGTLAGTFFRFAGAALGAVGFYNSLRRAGENPSIRNNLGAIASGASLTNRLAAAALSTGLVEEKSVIGKIAAEKLVGRFAISAIIDGFSAALDLADGIGLSIDGDMVGATFAFTRAAGGGLMLGSSLGAASWTGPAGVALVFAGVVGPELVRNVKDAEKYGEASRKFLITGGYSPAAADKIIWHQRISYETDKKAPQMLLLARYAVHTHKTIKELQDWINNQLTDEQLEKVLDAINIFDHYYKQHFERSGADDIKDAIKYRDGSTKLAEMIDSSYVPASETRSF